MKFSCCTNIMCKLLKYSFYLAKFPDWCPSLSDLIPTIVDWRDGDVFAQRRSFRSAVISQQHSWQPSSPDVLHSPLKSPSPSTPKAQREWNASEHGGDVRAPARGLVGREDGQVQHNPWAWSQLPYTCSGQGLLLKSTNKSNLLLHQLIFCWFRWNMYRAWKRLPSISLASRCCFFWETFFAPTKKSLLHTGNLYGQCSHQYRRCPLPSSHGSL